MGAQNIDPETGPGHKWEEFPRIKRDWTEWVAIGLIAGWVIGGIVGFFIYGQ